MSTTIRTIKRTTDCQKFFITLAARELASEYGVEFISLSKNSDGYYIELTSGYYIVVTNGSEYEFLGDAGQMVFGVVIEEETYDELISGSGRLAA